MANEPEAPFGQELRRLRQAAGLSQEDLAERAGLTSAAIGALERGERRRPYPHTVRALAGALGLSPEEQTRFFMSVPRRQTRGDDRSSSATRDEQRRRSLPALTLTPLVGRERDVAIVVDLVRHGGARLVTLTGPGGVGKTRVALEIAERLGNDFADGPVWVDLAPVREPDLVPATIARTLGLTENPGQTIAQGLESFLGHREVFLILDNFEHLLAATSAFSNLLERCPELAVLVTSRESLGIRGEYEVQLPPLGLPNQEAGSSAERIARSDAVALFLQRVRSVQPEFELTGANAPVVAAICARLDGIPLALELAAAQLKYMSLSALQHRLDNRLALLDGGPRDLPARQRSLQATVAWSHQLLTGPEQALFRRLAIFVGGFSVDAVEAVCGSGEPAGDGAHALVALVDKSLIQTIGSPGGDVRFTMLETIREYAWECLLESGEQSSTADRHADYFCAFAEAAAPHMSSAERGPWLQRLDVEEGNVRRAFSWTTSGGDPCVGLRLAGALAWFWAMRGSIAEGTRWIDELLSRPISSCSVAARAGALYAAAGLAWKRGDLALGRRYAEESVELRRSAGEDGLALALAMVGLIATSEGDLERACRLQEESLELFRSQRDRWGIAYALANLGDALLQQGRLVEARRHYAESLQHFTDVDDTWGRGIVLHALGNTALAGGDAIAAAALYDACIALFRSIGNHENVGRALIGLAAAKLSLGDSDEAQDLLTQSITIWSDLGSRAGTALCLAGLASIQAARGNLCAAARLLGAADAHGSGFAPVYLIETGVFSHALRAVREKLSDESIARAWTDGELMTPSQAVEIALGEADGTSEPLTRASRSRQLAKENDRPRIPGAE